MKNNKKYIRVLSLIVIVFTIVIFANNVLKDTKASSETTSNILNENASLYITNLYNNNSKKTVANNNINYNYAEEVSLMNDNFGNIRYYGKRLT